MSEELLVCVGGPSAGKRVHMSEGYQDIKVMNPIPAHYLTRSWSQAVDDNTVFATYTVYSRQRIEVEASQVEYLAPYGESGTSQIKELLKGYRP